MSCHSIGHGLNHVMEEVVELFDEGKIPEEAIRRIGSKAMQAVNYCDGNEFEAVEAMHGYRCGRCLKEATDEDRLYSLFRIDYRVWDKMQNPFKFEDEPLASYELCADCFDTIVGRALDDTAVSVREAVAETMQ